MTNNGTATKAPIRTRVAAGMGILAMALSSVAPAALAQDGASRIDELRALANAARDNAIGSQVAFFDISDVHGAAAAFAIARFFAEEFRKHACDFGTLCHAMAMTAMR